MNRTRHLGGIVALSLVGAYAVAHRLGTTSGSTVGERARDLPGDDLIEAPTLVTNHAATLGAPPSDVWPWLTRLAPCRLVHPSMGRPAAVPRQLAERLRAGSRPGA